MTEFAKVKDGKVIQTYSINKQYVDDNGVRFPVSIWNNDEYLKKQNLFKVIQADTPNEKFYEIGGNILSYDAKANRVLREYQYKEKSVETLKFFFDTENHDSLKEILKSTNYHILRKQEDSDYKIPESVSKWRAQIYKEFDDNSTAIASCDTIEKFEKLTVNFTNQPSDVV
tara:strand:+ start:324 stop:836 length:513 start_codon:yes stop_codon:yes gene_type:complete